MKVVVRRAVQGATVMVLCNHTHPLTPERAAQVAAPPGETPAVRALAAQVDRARPPVEVARAGRRDAGRASSVAYRASG